MNENISVAIGVLAVSVIFYYIGYINLIQKRNSVQEAFSGINIQLKKRYDLIPNILTIAKAFMDHERNLMEEITKLRARAIELSDNIKNTKEKIKLDSEIASKMGQIIVAMENYPELKSNDAMLEAIRTYKDVEDNISASRRFYNAGVRELNNMTDIFPLSLIAKIHNVEREEYFNTDEDIDKGVDAAKYLK